MKIASLNGSKVYLLYLHPIRTMQCSRYSFLATVFGPSEADYFLIEDLKSGLYLDLI